MAAPTPEPHAGLAPVVASELSYGLGFIRKHGFRLLLVFLGILLPLLGFAALVEELHEDGGFFFDAPVLLALRQWTSPQGDSFFVLMSELGYHWGVIPLDVAILGFLAWHRRFRDGLFFGLSVIGSALINLGSKTHFARARPDLWLSLAPETTYSFPSGHAMGSATLAVAVVLLCWPTRWRWWAMACAGIFTLLVGVSRVYLGVHYPSDILAGWAAGMAWVTAMYYLVATRAAAPPRSAAIAAEPDMVPHVEINPRPAKRKR